MLNDSLLQKLNSQLSFEAYSSNLYLQMSSWCSKHGYSGSAAFLYKHAEEEREHMTKIFKYINDTGHMAIVDAVEKPKSNYSNLEEVFKETMKHELKITKSINELVDLALSLKDYSTFHFLQWYVAEQHEEEKVFHTILDKIRLSGGDDRNVLFVDKEIYGLMK